MKVACARVRLAAIALALFVATAGTSLVAAQQAPGGPSLVVELIRVAEDVYSFRYAGQITMFIVTDEGVITANPPAHGGENHPG